MKKLLVIIFGLILNGSLFALIPEIVHDPANMVQSVLNATEQLRATMEQINNTYKQLENQYQQIKQAQEAVRNINWEEFGDKFKVGKFSNPIEAMQEYLNVIDRVKSFVSSDLMQVNGHGYSIADLTGLNGKTKKMDIFVKDTGQYFTANYNKLKIALTKSLTDAEKTYIMLKTGMTPETYAMNKHLEKLTKEKTAELIALSTEEASKEIHEYLMQVAPLVEKILGNNSGDVSPVEVQQVLVALNKQMLEGIALMQKTVAQVGGYIATKETEERHAREAAEEQKNMIKGAGQQELLISGQERVTNPLGDPNKFDDDYIDYYNKKYKDSAEGTFKILF